MMVCGETGAYLTNQDENEGSESQGLRSVDTALGPVLEWPAPHLETLGVNLVGDEISGSGFPFW